MEKVLLQLAENRMLLAAVGGWLAAQVLKAAIYAIVNHSWRWERLWGAGGMPSSHGAIVCALLTAAAFETGLSSPLFAVCAVVAAVVLHDARGVRLETGKQAQAIHKMAASLSGRDAGFLRDLKLKELVGHTPSQVLAGAMVGFVMALLIYL